MKIKFTDDCSVEAQGEIVQTFNKGQVYELGTQSAYRWIRRQLAVEVQGAPTPAPKKRRGRPKKVAAASGGVTAKVKGSSAVLDDTKAAPGGDDSDSGLGAKPDAGAGEAVSKSDSSGDK